MRLVVALGGNALLERGEAPDCRDPGARTSTMPSRRSPPLARANDLVITHGNGPQVGLARRSRAPRDPALPQPYPFDVLGAQTQGMIGYWLVQALRERSARPPGGVPRQPDAGRRGRPGVRRPTKFVGPVYGERRRAAGRRARAGQSARTAHAGDGSCPHPSRSRCSSCDRSRCWSSSGAIVVCAGGGGIPVRAQTRPAPARGRGGHRQGPHRRAARLGTSARTRCCSSPTSRRSRMGFGTPHARPIHRARRPPSFGRRLPCRLDGTEGRGRAAGSSRRRARSPRHRPARRRRRHSWTGPVER